jgi:hypothetical protein
MRYDIQTTNVLHLRTGASGSDGDFSPDGIWVSYESKDNETTDRLDYDIYLIRANGGGAIFPLTKSISMDFDPAWRPITIP